MPTVARLHTRLVVALVALVPLTPVALRLYARLASIDRAPAVAANEHVFRSLHHPTGARVVGSHVYPVPRWGHAGSLVPISDYRTEFFVRLPRALPQRAIRSRYPARLDGRTIHVELFDLRGGSVRDYGIYVSQ